jgi:VanZ family protein
VTLSDALARRRVRLALPALWAALVLGASVVDPPVSGPTPAGPFGVVGLDKVVHAGAYGVLAVLLATVRPARSRLELAALTLASAGFGAAVEVVQLSFPARSFSGADALANLLGAAVAIAVWVLARRRLRALEGG